MRSRLVLLTLLLSSMLGVAYASDEELVQARRHYQSGIAHYNLEEYATAIAEFEEAYRIHPDPVILYNLAQTHRLSGNAERALHFYRAFLRSSSNPANRAEVLQRIADMEKALAEKKSAPPAAVVEPAPAPPVAVTPSPAPVAAPTPAIAAPAESVTARPAPKPTYKKWWVWTLVGVVVVGAAVGVGLGVGLQPTRNSYPRLDF